VYTGGSSSVFELNASRAAIVKVIVPVVVS
jgi:hypothetical protein